MDNIAIQIDHVDQINDDQNEAFQQRSAEDAELGVRKKGRMGSGGIRITERISSTSSLERLIPRENGKHPPNSPSFPSTKSSAKSSLEQGQKLLTTVFLNIITFGSTTKVFWIVVLYTIFGAKLFMLLEVPTDLEEKRKAYEYHLVVRDALLFKIERIHESRMLEKAQHWKEAILEFERHSELQVPEMDNTSWTFWMSILYCATIYTTVGYGNIACVTTGGRVATILYAICGIPLMIVVLDQLGTFLLRKMKQLSCFIDDILFYLGVKYRLVRLEDQEAFIRYIAICRTLARFRLIPSTITLSITDDEAIADQQQTHSAVSSSSSMSLPSSMSHPHRSPSNLTPNFQDRRSLKIAISRGSLLQNIGPFYIESIDVDSTTLAEIEKHLLLSPPRPTITARRASKGSTTAIHLTLEEADELLTKTTKEGGASQRSCESASMEGKRSNNKSPQQGNAIRRKRSPPLLIALCFTTGWIAFAAAVFCLWEEWSYFTSVYFFFISMSTIGFGDVTPQHPQYMIMTFFVVIVGLSLVSVCINVVQEKVAQIYMDLLNKMLQQYIKAKDSGDVEAIKGAMAGFNARCKYLMPFISKNQGIRVMNQFKEEAKAMGVELPEVMTELNEETGKPTFCKIFGEKSAIDMDQFLEKAQQQGKMRRNAHTQTKLPMPKTHKFFISKAEADKEEFEVQTEWQQQKLEMSTQTVEGQCTESGIQCCPLMLNACTEWDQNGVDNWTNTEAVQKRNMGVQPEVSCIMRIIDDDESDFELSDYDEEDEEADLSSSGPSRLGGSRSPADAFSSSQQSQLFSGSSREGESERQISIGSKRSVQMQRVPEFELDNDPDQQHHWEDIKGPLALPPLVTIRMPSKAATDEEAGDEPSKERAKKRKKNSSRTQGQRYLRNAAVQTKSKSDDEVTEDFSAQFGFAFSELREVALSPMDFLCSAIDFQTESADLISKLADNWTQSDSHPAQWSFGVQTEDIATQELIKGLREMDNDGEEEEHLISDESANNLRSNFGTQTEVPRKLLFSKRVQTDRPLLISRPVQTQLTSTFRRLVEGGGDREKFEAQIKMNIEEEREREELKKQFELEDEQIEVLRKKVKEMRRKKRREVKKKQRKGEEQEEEEEEGMRRMMMNSSSEDSEELGEEERAMLAEEVRKMRMQEEEEEEEEEDEEEGRVLIGRKKVGAKGDLGTIWEEPKKEFTLQISQPIGRGHIMREKYEETILDIQLIRSPFFETRYLPQSEEQRIFAETEANAREPTRKKKTQQKANEQIDIGKLLMKLNRLEAVSVTTEDDELEGMRGGIRADQGGGGQAEGELISQFTAESSSQTMGEFNECQRKREAEQKWHKWTQTNGEVISTAGRTKQSLIERAIGLWRGKTKSAGQIQKKSPTKTEEATRGDESEELPTEQKGQKESTTSPSMPMIELTEELLKVPKRAKTKGEESVEEMEMGGTIKEMDQEKAIEGTVPLDLSQIVIVQTPEIVEPRKILPPIEGTSTDEHAELVPLEKDELAQFMAMFPGLLGEFGEEEGSKDKEDQKSQRLPAPIGKLQVMWQSAIEEEQQKKEQQKQKETSKLISDQQIGMDQQQIGEGIRLIPLAKLIRSEGAAGSSKRGAKTAESDVASFVPKGIRPWPSPPGPPQYGQAELHYYRRWIERLLMEAKEHSQRQSLYDIPLRDISEFLRVKRHELSELERQKQQMERMAQLADHKEALGRTVDVSIQAGVHSRMVPILMSGDDQTRASQEEAASDRAEINYLANPLYPIARVRLKTWTMKDDGTEEVEEGEEKEDETEKEDEEEEERE